MDNKELSIKSDSNYKKLLLELKEKVRSSQLKAAIKVNYELLDLYWTLGEDIVKNQEQHSWGDAFIKSLAKDLQKEFPDMKGFSETNIKYIRRWYLFYMKGLQGVAEIENNDSNSKGLQPVAQFDERVINHVKQIPWGHNQRIINKCKTIDEAIYYVDKTIENGWSRNVLVHQIESGLYGREGKSITNFEKRLPALQSDLAKQTLKDPYNFDFLTIREGYDERELQKELVDKISDFLLELGEGFAYIGKEYHLNINGDDFYIDLLFYNLKLHSYIVIELKAEKFKPEHVGQLNFYVTAVNRELKTDRDNATIGLLICKDKNDVVCEYSLEQISQPMGISNYEITKLLEAEYKSSLPSIEEIEKQVKEMSVKTHSTM
ncbi:MAG TPA: PDDEXK nuclease domain-containing protein [Sphaerochaeta sp.]|nr:PDDEXK nuclease domain-containing protein [Sphaerochaeta sp.]HPY44974.1 PDDEXK nuclease domain-containing protein [Sphaerochaeta sp.]HQB04428.1 PDDEXK nuclease domain-containing protein [Sphaerochaeta sp.]